MGQRKQHTQRRRLLIGVLASALALWQLAASVDAVAR